jgi:hypothetical protein
MGGWCDHAVFAFIVSDLGSLDQRTNQLEELERESGCYTTQVEFYFLNAFSYPGMLLVNAGVKRAERGLR